MDIVDFMMALPLVALGPARSRSHHLLGAPKGESPYDQDAAIRELPYGSFLIALCAFPCVTET
jgi:hypothetical protein